MKSRIEPFALMLYRRHTAGESIREIADGLGIPEDRVSQRIRVAELYSQRVKESEPAGLLLEFCGPRA